MSYQQSQSKQRSKDSPNRTHASQTGVLASDRRINPVLLQVSFLSMPLYSVLPAITEFAVEQGWTKSYTRISDVGVGWYLAYFVMYMTCVEYFVYWMHRGLHDVKIGYK